MAETEVRRTWQVQERAEHRWIPARTSAAERVARRRLDDLRCRHPQITFRLVQIVEVRTTEVVDPAPANQTGDLPT